MTMRSGAAAVAAARAAIGARFRLQGRDMAEGLDCVGLAGLAYGVAVPGGYALRGGAADAVAMRIAGAGFMRVGEARPGDLLLIAAGPGQLHLAVRTDAGFVQAHAGLRRVVETPGWPDAPVLGVFRAAG
jgi:cell wall-associated NlpC family hydrolase